MQLLDSSLLASGRRSLAAIKGQATKRAKKAAAWQAECTAVHRAEFNGSVIHHLENVVHDGRPFTTADVLSRVGVTSTDGVQAVNSLLNAAAEAGAIRQTADATWTTVNEDRLYDGPFRDLARAAVGPLAA